LRALLLTGYGLMLGASGSSLVVRSRDGRREEVPLSQVDLVVVASGGVSVTSRALRLMAAAGVEMVVLDRGGMPVSVTYMSHYSRTPETRRAQYMASLGELGGSVASSLVACKVLSQSSTLRRLALRVGPR
jgi:CRISPR-associated protein Cas1